MPGSVIRGGSRLLSKRENHNRNIVADRQQEVSSNAADQAASSVFLTTGVMLTPSACMIFMIVANSGLVSPLKAR